MMICPVCGTDYDEEAVSCPHCGAEPQRQTRRGFGAGGLFPGWLAGLLVLVIVLALCAAAAAVVLALRSEGAA